MATHIHQGPTTALRRLLPPRPFDGRIPAGKLCPTVGWLAQLACADESCGHLVLGDKSHHEGRAQLHTRTLAGGTHLVGLSHRDPKWLLTQHRTAGLGAGHDLGTMNIRWRGHIDDVRMAQQGVDAGNRRGRQLPREVVLAAKSRS